MSVFLQNFVINWVVSESQGCRRVVFFTWKFLEKLKSLCSLSRLDVVSWEGAGETASSTLYQIRALSTENEADVLGIFDVFCEADQRTRLPSTAVMDTSSVSQARLSPSWSLCQPTTNSLQTLRVEALSPSTSPTTSVSFASLNFTFDDDVQFDWTRTVDLCTNSVAGSGDKRMQAEFADGSFAVHPVTSESASWRTWSVGLDPELHPNQLEYLHRSKSRTNLQSRFGVERRQSAQASPRWYRISPRLLSRTELFPAPVGSP